ncbi:polysaccharide pyruvyl transferase family protein [Agaribacter flavus]|uniref:Polysaccharide pyruvyl transferase family protein n=1 Tax=Agaribacter flavus TaxID=1902781 RepID=A0ABV7FKG5_9ALTE
MLFKKKLKKRSRLDKALEHRDFAYFWQPKDGVPNIGDYLAFETVNYCLNLEDKDVSQIKSGKLLSIGSVLHFAANGDTLWGTGKNGKISEHMHVYNTLNVSAVRGPLTRHYLLSKGIDCPEIYGDPGILAPFIYPASLLQSKTEKRDFVIVPQLNDDMNKYKAYTEKLISPRLMPSQFIKKLLSAKKVISSSLHGIILAEAYGIEAVFYDSGSGESAFKYEDYYKGTGRDTFHSAKSIEEALIATMPPIPDLLTRQQALIKAFPYDLYE